MALSALELAAAPPLYTTSLLAAEELGATSVLDEEELRDVAAEQRELADEAEAQRRARVGFSVQELNDHRAALGYFSDTRSICWWCLQYITRGAEEKDHMVARSKGGVTVPENLCLLHPECNQRAKGQQHILLSPFSRTLVYAGNLHHIYAADRAELELVRGTGNLARRRGAPSQREKQFSEEQLELVHAFAVLQLHSSRRARDDERKVRERLAAATGEQPGQHEEEEAAGRLGGPSTRPVRPQQRNARSAEEADMGDEDAAMRRQQGGGGSGAAGRQDTSDSETVDEDEDESEDEEAARRQRGAAKRQRRWQHGNASGGSMATPTATGQQGGQNKRRGRPSARGAEEAARDSETGDGMDEGEAGRHFEDEEDEEAAPAAAEVARQRDRGGRATRQLEEGGTTGQWVSKLVGGKGALQARHFYPHPPGAAPKAASGAGVPPAAPGAAPEAASGADVPPAVPGAAPEAASGAGVPPAAPGAAPEAASGAGVSALGHDPGMGSTADGGINVNTATRLPLKIGLPPFFGIKASGSTLPHTS